MRGAVPYRMHYDPSGARVEWVFSGGAPFRDPFFGDTIARLVAANPANRRSARPRTPAAALREATGGLSPAAFVFHVSRCGSTLLAQTLAASPRNLVISEAPILDDLLQMPRRDASVAEDDIIAWLQGAARAFGAHAVTGYHRLFIKLDCWNIFSLPLVQRAFPGVPLFFVFRHPIEVLVSLMRRPSMTLVHDVVPLEQLGLSHDARAALGREEYAAAALGAFFRAARAQRASLVAVGYEQLPHFVWESMPAFAFTAEECALFREAGTRDAKNPGQLFTPDSSEKRREASPALLQAAARWAEPDYHRWLDALSGCVAADFSRP